MSKLAKCGVCKQDLVKGKNAMKCNKCGNYFHPYCCMTGNIFKCPICKDIWEPLSTHTTQVLGPVYLKLGKTKSKKMKSSKRIKQTRRRRR